MTVKAPVKCKSQYTEASEWELCDCRGGLTFSFNRAHKNPGTPLMTGGLERHEQTDSTSFYLKRNIQQSLSLVYLIKP